MVAMALAFHSRGSRVRSAEHHGVPVHAPFGFLGTGRSRRPSGWNGAACFENQSILARIETSMSLVEATDDAEQRGR